MKVLLARILATFLLFHAYAQVSGQMDVGAGLTKDLDVRVRERITPEKIIWLSDTTNSQVVNAKALLKKGSGQADLEGRNLCNLVGGPSMNPSIVLDFGRELHGGIEIVSGIFEGKHPVNVRITLGESVSEAMSQIATSTATNDHALREFTVGVPWLGKVHIGNSGFRFAKIEMLDQDRTLKLKEINAISIYRPIPYVGSFRSSDSLLNEIWNVGAYTVHLNMQDYLWDGIKRDRLVWVGDMHPEVMTILSVFGNNEVVPKSLDLIQKITHLPDWMNGISSYSMWWIMIQLEWYWNTGDLSYLQGHQEYLFDLLGVLKSKIDDKGNEQLDGNRFLDWPTSPNKEAIDAGLQAMMVMTFSAGAEIASILGEDEKRSEYLQVIELLQKHVPDPNDNKSAAALLAISGLKSAKEINDAFLSVNPIDGISTFYGYYVLQARALAGDYQGAMEVIKKYWGGMLALGATTFWEDFDLRWMKNAGRIDQITPQGKIDVHATYGDYCYVGLRHSLCHGWASGPTAWLSEHVLGIEILEPGCTKVRVNPHLGELEWVEGSYPTPFGPITVRHSKTASGGIRSEIETPKEIEVVDI
ncbi:MAG: alpha-L-rhamnosidase [Saprospiraceae bacterium]|nr:alpha-L-rhamnosidase [Saprospiraceae bacterium]